MLYECGRYDQKPMHTWHNHALYCGALLCSYYQLPRPWEGSELLPIQPTEHLWGQILISRPGSQSLFDLLPETFIGAEVVISSGPVGLLHAKACLWIYLVHSGTATKNSKEPPSNSFALNVFVSSSIKETLHWNQWTSPKPHKETPECNPSFSTYCREHCAFQKEAFLLVSAKPRLLYWAFIVRL